MTNVKSTKKALIASILSLCMCFSMLLGTTFAWFTDSVTSNNNIITAGNLDVELYYQVEGQTDWTKVTETSNIFIEGALWEPGHTEVVKLKVVNEGTLAFQYQLGVNIAGETGATNKDGDKFMLSDYIKFDVVEGEQTYNTRDEAVAAVDKTATKLNKGFSSEVTKLEAGKETVVTMVVYMPANVGNEANHNGVAPTIKLGLNVFATQVTGEGDSFGSDYDADAWADSVEVLTAEDLLKALKTGASVKLAEDITLTETLSINAGTTAAINLDGKTLTGAIEVADNATLTVANGTIANTNNEVSAIQTNGGDLILDDVTIASARHGVRVEGGKVTINGGTYKVDPTSAKTQHAVNVSDGGYVVINGGTFIGPKGTMADSGAAVNVQAGSTVIINGGNFSGGKNNTLAAKGTLTVKGGTFDQDPSAFVAEGHKATKVGETYYVAAEAVKVVGNNDDLKGALTTDGKNPANNVEVILAPGTYTFPSSIIGTGVTINCEEGTVFTGTSGLNINGATVIGATFDAGDKNTSVSGTINGTFKNCTFTGGSEGVRWCYTTANTPVIFENCVFETTFRGIHFDGMKGDITFKNCEINGFNAFGGTATVTFEGCTFGYDQSKYNGLNMYVNTILADCKFDFVSGKTNFIDFEASGKTLSITNCTATLDGENTNIIDFVGGTYVKQTNITIDGVALVSTTESLKDAVEKGNNIILNGTVDLGGTKDNYITLTEDTTITGGTIKGTGWTGELNYGVNATAGDIVFDGVTFDTNDWTTEGWAKWGISVNVNGTANVTFKNCTFKGTQCPIYQSGSESVVTLENCKFETTSVAIQCEIYSGDFQLGQDLIVKGCDFTGLADVLHIYDYDKDPSSEAIAQYLTENGNTFTGVCKQTCK